MYKINSLATKALATTNITLCVIIEQPFTTYEREIQWRTP
jgi:hypothetical protein